MIRPVDFKMNEETAVNNYFQEEIDDKSVPLPDIWLATQCNPETASILREE